MKEILIVGLGLIGGSYASGLSNKGYTVYGVDIDFEAVEFAKKNNYIVGGSHDASDYISKVNIIVICLYPSKIKEFILKFNHLFRKNQIITDVCGIKRSYLFDVQGILNNAEYLASHPMAGKEKKGIKYSDDTIFKKANFLITPTKNNTKAAIKELELLALSLEFKNISIISAEKHDKMIGFTSQLTHAIAVSLVNSDTENDTALFIGDSYRDLTRIAMINGELWAELFLENTDYLTMEIDNFILELQKIKTCLKEKKKDELIKIFSSSTKKRGEM